MKRRNWDQLSRKLVDRFDLLYQDDGIESSIDTYAKDYFGAGVVQTPAYPLPFQLTPSSGALSADVTAGVAYDVDGNRIFVPSTETVVIESGSVNPMKAYIALKYKKTGANLVPKPSDPITSVHLNLIDDYDLVVLYGAPSPAPSYPIIDASYVILFGVLIPTNATLGTQCTFDDSVRMHGIPVASRVLFQEEPIGVVDGSNRDFLLTKVPVDANSIILIKDGVIMDKNNYVVSGQQVTFGLSETPQPGEAVYVIYLIGQTGAVSPIPGGSSTGGSLWQEVPAGAVDGVNLNYSLSKIPITDESVVVMIDGLVVQRPDYSVNSQAMSFVAGKQPTTGQKIYVTYLIGQTSVLSGGSSASYAAYGNDMSPIAIDGTIGVVIGSELRQVRFLSSTGGAQPVTATPQVQIGTTIGQELVLSGCSDVDYITLHDGDGLALNGPIDLKNGKTIQYVWSGSLWREISRR